jgi:bacitracin transport system permease protein
MITMIRLEMLKWKRSRILLLSLLAAGIGPLAAWLSASMKASNMHVAVTWYDIFSLSLQVSHLLVLPILFGALAAYIFVQEFQGGAFVNLYTLPVSRITVAVAKLATIFVVLMGLNLVSFLLTSVIGLAVAGPPSADVFVRMLSLAASTGLMAFMLVPIPMFIGIWTRHFIPPVVAASSFTLLNFVAIAVPDILGPRVPPAIPYYVILYRVGYFSRPPAVTWSLLLPVFGLFLALSLVTVMRRDVQ